MSDRISHDAMDAILDAEQHPDGAHAALMRAGGIFGLVRALRAAYQETDEARGPAGPVIVDNYADLAALAGGAVILDQDGDAWQAQESWFPELGRWVPTWQMAGDVRRAWPGDEVADLFPGARFHPDAGLGWPIRFPVRVLYRGEDR